MPNGDSEHKTRNNRMLPNVTGSAESKRTNLYDDRIIEAIIKSA